MSSAQWILISPGEHFKTAYRFKNVFQLKNLKALKSICIKYISLKEQVILCKISVQIIHK